MQDIIENIQSLAENKSAFVTATVVSTWGSGPRKVGSGMVIGPDDAIYGSVSGGCVEGNVVKEAADIRQTGSNRLLHYGITDDEAWEVGLSCGGKLDVLLEFLVPDNASSWGEIARLVSDNQGCVLSTLLEGTPQHVVTRSVDQPKDALATSALEAYLKRKSGIYEVEGVQYFHNVFPKKSQLVIVGAAHISSQLVELAGLHDFETIVIDPRGLFSDKTDFKVSPDQSHKNWPAEILPQMDLNSDVYAVMLTHDPKIDDQALGLLLKSEVSYIGALGSNRTHQKRIARLAQEGFSEEELDRIHAPIGVNINAANPKEIALSIVAELVKTRNRFLR